MTRMYDAFFLQGATMAHRLADVAQIRGERRSLRPEWT